MAVLALAGTALADGKKADKAKAADPTLEYLHDLLKAHRLNDAEGLDNAPLDAELKAMKDLPAIRTHCRALFNVRNVTDKTVTQLNDWLATKLDTTAAKVDAMKLSEVRKHLDRLAKKERGG